MASLHQHLKNRIGRINGDGIALSSSTQTVTYQSLLLDIEKRIQWLRTIDAKVVALHSTNCIEWVLLDLACQELGLVFIPLPTFFSADQIEQCLRSSAVDTLLADCQELPAELQAGAIKPCEISDIEFYSPIYVWKVEPTAPQNLPEGTQKITFTSGSTGNPKGVCLSRDHQWQVAQSLAGSIDIKQPRHLCLLPLSTLLENIAGVYVPLLLGGEVIIPSDQERGMSGSSKLDSAALLACISDAEPTTLILVPQLLTLLVAACINDWVPPQALRFIAVGGGKVSPTLIQQARSLGLPVYQGYGLSECGSVVALNTPNDDNINAVGKILPHCNVSIDNGEVLVSGAVHLGYLEEPASWYPQIIRTGDLGSITNHFLTIDGRQKNVIISSYGRNISPEWIESVLMSRPVFQHCAIVGDGKPHLVALVSALSAVANNDIEQWVRVCNQGLPDYARVGGWLRLTEEQFRPYLTANGRVMRQQIVTEFSAGIDQLYLDHSA